MALSGSSNYIIDRDTLATASLRMLGVVAEGGTATAAQLTTANQALNLMLKGLQRDGMHLWMRRSATLSAGNITEGQEVFTISSSGSDITADRPLDILEVTLEDENGNENNLIKISQKEYWELPDKAIKGVPTQWYYDPQLDEGDLYMWPTANTNIETNYALNILYIKPFDDVDSSTNDFEVPQEWLEVIKYGLAWRLAPEYGISLNERRMLLQEYTMLKNEALSWDTEHNSIYLRPEWRGGWRK